MKTRILTCIASLAVLACDRGATTVTPAEAPTPAPPHAEAEPTPPTTGEPDVNAEVTQSEPPAPTKVVCESKVADVPTALFGEKVLIRPPMGVELVEDNPTYATTFSSFVSTCDATVDRMQLMIFANDASKSLTAYLDEFLGSLQSAGYQDGDGGTVVAEDDAQVLTAVEYPAAGGQPPAKVLVAVARKFDNVIIVMYQTQPDQWDGLSNTFVASANSLLVIPN